MGIEKYVGRNVEIMYLGKDGKLSQRQIRIERIDGENVRAFCYSAKDPRVFKLDSILAVLPVVSRRRVG